MTLEGTPSIVRAAGRQAHARAVSSTRTTRLTSRDVERDEAQTTLLERYGELFAVQPFASTLVTMTLTGAHIDALLAQQFRADRTITPQGAGITCSGSASAPTGSRSTRRRS